MGSRTAISAGVLAVALAASPAVLPSSAALASDCPKGGGLLGGVTNPVCDAVGKVTGTVDSVTGERLKPATQGLNDTTGQVLGEVGETAPTTGPSAGAEPAPTPSRTALLPRALENVCLPVLACAPAATGAPATPGPEASAPVSDDTRTGDRRGREKETVVVPTGAPAYPDSEPHIMDVTPTGEPVTAEPTADPDEPRIDLLWPNPLAKDLSIPLGDRLIVRPGRPASDVLGTALTIALLISAIAATRVVQQRRRRAEQPESIPFEPLPANAGRHRLA
ncbi:hypothetical protein [Nonomuraea lactucae]|uniref:hypothetical protein n=1 Tax=Nonomuraea lactucae TaxID=2249762 RepID=UPI000DE50800|nr:hypothetical protein [Nonomuraea lactucae]